MHLYKCNNSNIVPNFHIFTPYCKNICYISINSAQRKHLQRLNKSLTDQIRLLKNQISRQRQEYEDKLSELRQELSVKHSARNEKEYGQVGTKNVTNPDPVEKDLAILIQAPQTPTQAEKEIFNGKHLSEIEVGITIQLI